MKEGAVTGAVLVVCESGSSSRCEREGSSNCTRRRGSCSRCMLVEEQFLVLESGVAVLDVCGL